MTEPFGLSEAELATLATQFYARPGNDSPPQTVPLAPRGSMPDTTSAASLGAAALNLEQSPFPGGPFPTSGAILPQPVSPGPNPIPPQTVPVAPRGEMPVIGQFAIPAGIIPTVPGVLASPVSTVSTVSTVPAPTAVTTPGWLTDVPPVPDLQLAPTVSLVPSAVPSTTTGDEANYYFAAVTAPRLTAPIPAVGDHYEIFDVHALRADFPILRETVNGKPLIWFDNAATTQKPQAVIDRLAYFYAHENSNIHRAAHELAARATDAYEDARDTVRRFIGAAKDENIVFVRGCTEAINLVAQSWGAKNLGPGDEIVITNLEHHANIVPWQMIAKKTGAVLKMAPVDDAGNLLLQEFEELLGPRTKIVSATQVSNALGTVTPVHKIVEMGHRYGARVLIDGAQSIPHVPIDVQACGADFFVFSGHKIYAPTGIGVLYATDDAMADTPPWQGGGNMIADVTLERSIFQGPPNKYEAGTGNIADAVGLGEALRYVEKVGVDRIAAYEHALLDYATPRLAAIPGVRIIGTADKKASVLSFVLAGHDTLEVGKALNTEGIAVRAGHHCAMPILRRMGVETTVRPSFAFYNTLDEIDVFLSAVRRIAESTPVVPGHASAEERRGCAG